MDDAAKVDTSKDLTGANPYDTVIQPDSVSASSSNRYLSSAISSDSLLYAGFGRRLVAVVIDWFITTTTTFIIGLSIQVIFRIQTLGSIANLLSVSVMSVYGVYFVSQKGWTVGKKIMGIRVQNIETGQNLDLVSAILREVVGKFISALVLCLGYFWMLWDDKKQTWHDKIAKSVVVKV